MKLIRFVTRTSSRPSFGTVIADHAVGFSVLQTKAGISSEYLSDSRSYLTHLPDSEQAARSLLKWGEQHFDDLGEDERFTLDAVRLTEPIEVAALFEDSSIELDQPWADFQADTDLQAVLDEANDGNLFSENRTLVQPENALRALYLGIGLCSPGS